MDTKPVPAPYAFFKKLLTADENLRAEFNAGDATRSDEQEMALYSRQQALTIAIDLWDGMSKGVGSYDALVEVYRRFHKIMQRNSASDDLMTGKPNPDSYKEILELLDSTGIDFSEKD